MITMTITIKITIAAVTTVIILSLWGIYRDNEKLLRNRISVHGTYQVISKNPNWWEVIDPLAISKPSSEV